MGNTDIGGNNYFDPNQGQNTQNTQDWGGQQLNYTNQNQQQGWGGQQQGGQQGWGGQ